MERKNQNLEFSQKLNAKSEECLERRSHNLFTITRPACASGGDIGVNTDTMHCNSKNSSFQNLSFNSNSNQTEHHYEDAEQTEDSQVIRQSQSDMSNSLSIKNHFGKKKCTNKYGEVGAKLKSELSKYKKELKEYNNTTKDLEEKYLKINYELNEMQQKHDRFVAIRKSTTNDSDSFSDTSSSTGSEFSLKRKYTQVFHRGSSFMTMLPPNCHSSNENLQSSPFPLTPAPGESDIGMLRRKQRKQPVLPPEMTVRQSVVTSQVKRQTKRRHPDNKENDPPSFELSSCLNGRNNPTTQPGLKDIYKVLKTVIDTNQSKQANGNKAVDLKELQTTIINLQNEQAQFRTIIQQQQSCLHDYHSRCIKAQHIMQTQQIEIQKLNTNNQQLESEISSGIDNLRLKIDTKLRDVSHLPQLVRDEQCKYEKVSKENNVLVDRLRVLQNDASQLKLKIEELGRKKVMTINRLKATERDLKIFKNYNTALKHEKRKLNDELLKLKEQLESVQNSSKRNIARQREQNEKQRRDLQKRVFELELKLSRSQNSTTSLIQERDSLIAELQTQLNTLVHNFEVSQKHIRVLRRHIYSMSGGNVRSNSRLLNETAP